MRRKISIALLLCLATLLHTAEALAQASDSDEAGDPVAVARAVRRTGEIRLDGILDEEAWAAAPVASGFIQREPVEGNRAEEDTRVRILYDNNALYVGALLLDSDPDGIVDRLVRRDEEGEFDYFEVSLDPNLDRRTGYVFRVSAANVQADRYVFNDTEQDRAWDAVWESEVRRTPEGWSVEIRIPLSQVRYESHTGEQTWGVNFSRRRLANNERTYFSLESRLQRGMVSQFGILQGVEVPGASRRLELLPYVLSSAHQGPSDVGDPFFSGSEASARVGVEVSYGIGANFTLDATINPDFGQVEADPAVINLSAFETFLRERRPFFVKDARTFDFGLSGMQNTLFYSRRLGRSPQGGAPVGADFSDRPAAATILGAAKLSGRTSSGLSIGVLAAVTQEESGQAFFASNGTTESFIAEPQTQYGVLSLQQDLNNGASQIGGIFTVLDRNLPADGSFDFLTSRAFNAGINFEHQWGDREWALEGFIAGSWVQGDSTAILRIQRSSNHFFQRPDATRFDVDSTATSLTGREWRLQFARRSGTHWTGGAWIAELTSGFEVNDLGFSRSSEKLDAGFRVNYREIVPGDVFRNYSISLTTIHNWRHEALDDAFSFSSWGDAHSAEWYSLRFNSQLLNYWNINPSITIRPETVSSSATRGGPLMTSPGSIDAGLRMNTDRRKALSIGANANINRGQDGKGDTFRAGFSLTARPSPSILFSVAPQYTTQTVGDQYVTSTDAVAFGPTFGRRYLFADLERKSVSMETRLNVSFTPDLTLQLFAQPLISSADYVEYKQLLAPRTFAFEHFTNQGVLTDANGQLLCQGGQICFDGEDQHLDFDGDGLVDFLFRDRDFNQRTLVGNAVLRWEYRPGSTIFFVWQHRQFDRVSNGDFSLGRDVGSLFGAPSDDVFTVKFNYWIGL